MSAEASPVRDEPSASDRSDQQLRTLVRLFFDAMVHLGWTDDLPRTFSTGRLQLNLLLQLDSLMRFIADIGLRVDQRQYLQLMRDDYEEWERWCDEWAAWVREWEKFATSYNQWRLQWQRHLHTTYSLASVSSREPELDLPALFG